MIKRNTINLDTQTIPHYFPLERGRYEVKPGLHAFGTNFGNGTLDHQVFQIDSNFCHYRAEKLKARDERIYKYYQTYDLSPGTEYDICRFIIHRLVMEHPDFFYLKERNDGIELNCRLTNELLQFNSDMQLLTTLGTAQKIKSPYISGLDALACQIQEDLAIINRLPDNGNWISALHLCFPNHWSAEEKIGKDFIYIHHPVPGIESINKKAQPLVNAMINRGPYVRFAWGLGTDTYLNHHPLPPIEIPYEQWTGRLYNKQDPHLFLRVERQTIWGFPDSNAALFTIRTYFTDCTEIKRDPEQCLKLSEAINSMSSEALSYKGIIKYKEQILDWLDSK